ncbi:MAG: helix-turn-helix transcriptional regulator [Planctomycetes bacterium]|nr:helix-turn-helix transcriptional regulator [Planctomycetota bacterium]
MEKNIEAVFGRIIRRHRERCGLSQEDFADVAQIHRTYVSSIERGKVQVSIGIAQKLAVALGIPLSRIWSDIERELGPVKRPQPRGKSARTESP